MRNLISTKKWIFCILLWVVSNLYPCPAGEISITIFHTNDIHQNLTPLARIAGYVAEYRKQHPNTVFVDGGDSFDRGSSLVALTRGETIVGAMARMGYDMVALGNHDWIYGDQRLREVLDMYPGLKVLGSNLGTLKGDLPGNIPRTVIREFNGIRIGFLGLTLDTYGKNIHARPWLHILNCRESARQAISELKAARVDLIVAVTHLGFQKMKHETNSTHPSDVDLVKENPDIKVVVGGHSHTFLEESITRQVYRETGSIIVQCGSGGAELGRLTIRVDSDTRRITDFEVEHIPVDAKLPELPEVVTFIEQKYRKYMPQARATVGEFRENVEFHNLAYWYADFIRKQTGADLVLIPRRALYDEPTSFPKGKVTVEQLYSYFYDHYLIKGMISGAELLVFCNASERRDRFNPFHHRGRPFSGDAIFYSGMDVKFNPADASVNFGLVPDKEYTLVMPWPFADGDIAKYRYQLPSRTDVKTGSAIAGLAMKQAVLLPVTTREILVWEGMSNSLVFSRKYAEPLPDWDPWTKWFELRFK